MACGKFSHIPILIQSFFERSQSFMNDFFFPVFRTVVHDETLITEPFYPCQQQTEKVFSVHNGVSFPDMFILSSKTYEDYRQEVYC